MKSLTLQPIKKVEGTIYVPGSKSISNRVLLLAALANGTTYFRNLLNSDDVRYMLHALKALGLCYQLTNNRTFCTMKGNNGIFIVNNPLKLFLGNSGITMRSLTAVLCLSSVDIILTGEPRMKKRPIGDLVDALCQGGAKIEYLENKYYPPLRLRGKFTGGNIIIDGSISSQFLTALLISAPLAINNTVISLKRNLVSRPYIDMTLNLMRSFGIIIDNQLYKRFIIHGNQQYHSPGRYFIEGDASSASYFLSAAAIKGGTVKVMGIHRNSIQGDIRCANVLEQMGASITWGDNFVSCTRRTLNGINMDMNHIPDVAMTIAIVALFAKGDTLLRNIYSWRIKESNRLSSMSIELRKVGAIVQEGKDFIRITPPSTFKFVKIHTYNDHRIAMCFSLIALSGQSVTILNHDCVKKTFPKYFKYLSCISQFL